jgi:X-X-X-Leu-X-X-Gly heptad repeat protein
VTVPARARWRTPATALSCLTLALVLPGAAAAVDTACEGEPAAVQRVEIRADLAGDGEVVGTDRERIVEDAEGGTCRHTERLEGAEAAAELPVAVGVLHRGDVEGALEPGELGDAEGRVVTRVAVRDRTAEERTFEVDAPGGPAEVTRRVGVPQLVRVEVTYPSGWSTITPAGTGARTDVVDGGVRVTRTELLFPPVTPDEVVVAVGAVPNGGVPEVVVAATPVGDEEVARLATDELDRDASAVVAALTEVGADGAEQLADGTRDLADGVGELADGAGQLTGGLQEAAAGTAQLEGGATELAGGAGELATGIAQLAAGLDPLADGVRQLGAGARQIADGNRQLASELDGAAAGADQLADGNREIADATRQLADGIEELAVGSRELTGGASELRDELAQLPDLGPVTDLVIGPIEELLAGTERFGGVLDELAAGAEELATGTAGLADGNRELATGLEQAAEANRALADGGDQVADGAEAAADGADELAEGAGQQAAGSTELAAGARELAGGVGAAAAGIGEVAGASGQLAAGAEDTADGAGELAAGAGELPEALREATGTADRAGARQAEDRALVAEGRARADELVAAAAGDAPTGVLSTRLTAAGSQPLPWLPLTAAALVVVAAAAGGRRWWTRRAGGAA